MLITSTLAFVAGRVMSICHIEPFELHLPEGFVAMIAVWYLSYVASNVNYLQRSFEVELRDEGLLDVFSEQLRIQF